MVETKINKLIEIISKLRDPNFGCEWTKIQNSESLLPFLKEEVDSVDGDLYIVVVFRFRIRFC